MPDTKEKKFLTVAPFECAWRKDLKFSEAGRGCVAFDAFAHNDVTLVFRENVGSQHYHYKRDSSPHYTVILGSHRNKRLKIEVGGETVVDVAGIGLCCSSAFQSYWISIYDGLISIGKGRYPFQNLVFQWLDSHPNCSVQYVGLSSWDKHVGYRNVSVLPLNQNHIFLWKQVECCEYRGEEEGDEEIEDGRTGYEKWGLENFLESWELADMFFIVGKEERPVPAHKVILQASGSFPVSSSNEDVIQLQEVSYPTLHALLRYIYTGKIQISELQLGSLWALSSQFEVTSLVKQCEETIERFKLNKKLFDSGKKIEVLYPVSQPHSGKIFPFGLPISTQRLKQFQLTGQYSDINISIEGHGLVTHPHKIVLGLWSVPFAKMFTNGMSESCSSEVCLRDVSAEAFSAMLDFMYSGELSLEDSADFGTIILQLLLLADQFGVSSLHQECCKMLYECLTEGWSSPSQRKSYVKSFSIMNNFIGRGSRQIWKSFWTLDFETNSLTLLQESVCTILQAVSSIPSCKLIEEMCKKKLSMHFDYCTTASLDFTLLNETNFSSIIQHPDLTVTSEERVLNAILMWCMEANQLCGWEMADELMINLTPELLFKERLPLIYNLLPFVRFPLMPFMLLKQLENSNMSRHIPAFNNLVKEAINYLELGLTISGTDDQNARFQHRRSSFKEHLYICDGDSNGVLYFAGTSYGDHQWLNPMLAKKINIMASSPTSRYTDPKTLVSRTYAGTSFAGPRMEDGRICAWWKIDIGKDHQLMCNYYTMRQDGSRAYVRSWNFQGSMDGNTWLDLRVHENDQTICKPGQFASWPIMGPNALLPFRFFKIIQTGPTTDTSNPWNFSICFLELYGYFH